LRPGILTACCAAADGKPDKAGICTGSGDPKVPLLCNDRISNFSRSEKLEVKWGGDDMWKPDPIYIQNSQRDRPFYVVLATEDCMPLKEGVSWRIHFANGGSKWWSEFGTNEQGLNIMYIVFMCAYLLLCAAQVYSRTIYECVTPTLNLALPSRPARASLLEVFTRTRS